MLTSEQIEQAQREGKEIRFMTDGQIVALLLSLILTACGGFVLFMVLITSK